MEVSRWIFAKALVITLLVLLVIYSINVFLSQQRETALESRMEETIETLEEMEALTQLMHMFGGNATCVALKSQLRLLDQQVWKLGDKIEAYRQLTQEYMSDPYYLKQKRRFNRQEVLYLSLMKQVEDKCDLNTTIILYFYTKGEECRYCDDQAFVLNHLNQRIDDELSIFGFDTSLGIPSVDVLVHAYNITSYPCIVVEDETYCSLHNIEQMESLLCQHSPELSICT